ncbi:hypothetical protein BD779DRAFT_1675618 [Infundibulicybe gibba]|nr:hypothetical protein BD779DRAFT_1675618 [Infundibulicybe gibba]
MDLPPEIIQLIFLELCLSKTTFPLQKDEPRLLITRVCSQWRAIALALPSLWANIEISLDSPPPFDPFRTWISRSAQSTLSFETRTTNAHNYDMSSTAIVDLIFPIIQRCTSLKLNMDKPTFKRLLSLPPGLLHALQEISIIPTPDTTLGTIPRATAFQQCPRLRRVRFAFPSRLADLAAFNLPWHQLTHLDMYSCLLLGYKCLDVLRQCTALEEFRIGISTFSDPFHDLQGMEALPHSIVLPSLHTLRIHLDRPTKHSIHFFHALRLPILRSLCIVMPRLPSVAMLTVFKPLFSETIRHLDFPSWIHMDLPSVLVLVPNLETLKHWEGLEPRALEMLGCGALPRLMTLELSMADSRDLLNMLEARVDAARSDTSITVLSNVSAVDISVGIIEMSKTRIAALRAAGIQVVFRNWLCNRGLKK